MERIATSTTPHISVDAVDVKAWVERQVNAQLDELLRRHVKDYMLEMRCEVEAVKDMQAKLSAVLECLPGELASLKDLKSLKTANDSCSMTAQAEISDASFERLPQRAQTRLSQAQQTHARLKQRLEHANNALFIQATTLRATIDEVESTAKLDSSWLVECEALVKSTVAQMQQVELDGAKLKKYLEESNIRLCETLLANQSRAVADLRNEMTVAIQHEAAAVATLDNRFYVLDQRVSERMEELALLIEVWAAEGGIRPLERGVTLHNPEWSFCGGRMVKPAPEHQAIVPTCSRGSRPHSKYK